MVRREIYALALPSRVYARGKMTSRQAKDCCEAVLRKTGVVCGHHAISDGKTWFSRLIDNAKRLCLFLTRHT
jgi:hypothetical protein